ncbi:MAG: FHIPEP family type III secretion protein, partial [Pseudomonadota bacterium]
LAGGCFFAGRRLRVGDAEPAPAEAVSDVDDTAPTPVPELTWDDISPVDAVGLEVGYRLIPLVDKNSGGPLIGRIKGVRKKLTERFGFLIPAVHIRDNLDLQPASYRVTLMGVTVGEGDVMVDKELAINPGQVYGKVEGIATRDPAFGLEAYWINTSQNEEAQMYGYTVVDPATVVATHLSQLLTKNAHELLGHEEVEALFERLAERSPKLVEELTPKLLPMAVIVKTLQSLLAEGIPVNNLKRIAECLAEHAVRTQDPDMLAAAARVVLGRSIVQNITGLTDELPVATLDSELVQLLENTTSGGEPMLEPGLLEKLHADLAALAERQETAGEPAVLLVAPKLRPWLARAFRSIRNLHVLAYSEVPDDKRIRMIEAVSR